MKAREGVAAFVTAWACVACVSAGGASATAATDATAELALAPDVEVKPFKADAKNGDGIDPVDDLPDSAEETPDVAAVDTAKADGVDPVEDAGGTDLPDSAEETPDVAAVDTPKADGGGDLEVTLNPGPDTPIPPMEYAPTPLPFAGTVTCGAAPAPYFWATAAEPAPLACTTTCAPAPHAVATVCAGGQCLAASCESGWQDQNGWGADGCEASVPVACVLYVEVTADAATADGTPEHPFAAIVPAVAKASPGCEIRLGAGTFDSPTYGKSWMIELNKPGLVLRGQGPGKTRIRSVPAFGPQPVYLAEVSALMASMIRITADGVVLEGFAVEGGGHGVTIDKAAGVLLRNLAVGPLTAPNSAGASGDTEYFPLSGIRLLATNGVRVTLANIHEIQGSIGCGTQTLNVAGIYGDGDTQSRVLGTQVKTLTGGTFNTALYAWYNACSTVGNTGTSIGIQITGRASGCAVSKLAQGKLVSWDLSGNPWGSKANPVKPYVGVVNDLSNTYNGLPFLHFANCAGLTLDALTFPANASTIDITGSSNVVVKNCSVGSPDWSGIRVDGSTKVQILDSQITGLAPGIDIANTSNLQVKGNQLDVAARTTMMVGVSIGQCGDCEFKANNLSLQSLTGSVDPGWNDYTGTLVQAATGVSIQDCAGCNVSYNEIIKVVGNAAFFQNSKCRHGGSATGLAVSGPGSLIFELNRIENVQGGPAVCGYKAIYSGVEETGYGGSAQGAKLSVATVVCAQNVFSTLAVGNGLGPGYPSNWLNPPPDPTAVALIAPSGTVCDHVTLSAVDTATTSSGITFTNSILASGDACSLGKNPKISMSYSDVWTKGGCTSTSGLGSGAGMISIDPQFVDPKNGDVHLLPSSPCVDSADPAAEFCSETLPNGCRADMGAYGGTSASTPASGAKSCACP